MTDQRPRCPFCRRVMRLQNIDDAFAAVQVNSCTECGLRLPYPELVQRAYPEDELRQIALRLVAGQATIEDAQALARAWLKYCE